MNTKGVEDGIVCEFCGTHCYQGAEHNARVEDNARFDDAKPTKPSAAVPVEERTAEMGEAIVELLQGYRAKHKDCKDLTGHPDSLKSMAKDWRCDICKQADPYLQPQLIQGVVKCKCGHPKHVDINGTQSCGYCCNEYGRGMRTLEDVCSVYVPVEQPK